jgi:tRNA(adenine34) deaminase
MMHSLILLARDAAARGEVPIAACIVDGQGNVVAEAANAVEAKQDATQHAELMVIQQACATLGQKYLSDYTLYVTLEPCAMCAAAIAHAKIGKLVFGAYDAKGGGVEHGARVFAQPTCHHTPEIIGGVEEAECAKILKDFFSLKR